MGRKSKPVILRAESSKHRNLVNSPQLPLGMPDAPVNLTAEEYTYYHEFAHAFDQMKVLTQVDAESVGNLARLAVIRDELQKAVDEDGLVYKSEGGRNGNQIKVNPAVTALRAVIGDMRSAMSEFGLTPASRVKIKTEEGDQMEMFPSMAKVQH